MEFKKSTDAEFNRRILALKTVVIEGEQSFHTIQLRSGYARTWSYEYAYDITLDKLAEHRDKKLPLESLFMRNCLYDSAFICIAVVSDDTVVLVTADSLYGISERDWEVWIAEPGVDGMSADASDEEHSFKIELSARRTCSEEKMPKYVTPLAIRGTQSFDGLVVEMGILVDGTPDGEYLVMTTESFSMRELERSSDAEAKGMSDWINWTDLTYRYAIEKVRILAVENDEIRLGIGEEKFTLSCREKLDVISQCKKEVTSKVLTRIYATKDGIPLYLSPKDAKRERRRIGERIDQKNVLQIRTFEVQGTPSFQTVFIRFALMDINSTVLLCPKSDKPRPYPLEELKGKSPMLYKIGSPPAYRILAVAYDVLYVAEHGFDSEGRLTTRVIRLWPGQVYYWCDDPLNEFSRYGIEIFTEKGK